MNHQRQLSAILVCSLNDPDISQVVDRYLKTLSALPVCCDLTVVDNGTYGHVADRIQPLLEASDIPSRIVCLHRGCGESVAIRAALRVSEGQLIGLLPPYVQTEPSDLEKMLGQIEQGADYVASWRRFRVDSRWNRFKSTVFNRVTRLLTGIMLHDINSGLRVMTRKLANDVPIYGDLHRFWPILAAKQGYRVTEIATKHLEERVKKGDYRFGIYLRRVLDLFTLFFLIKFTQKPLRFFGLVGSAIFAVGASITVVLCLQRLLGSTPLADRPALIFGVLLIVLGIQLFSLGLLGELIIFTHGKALQHYHVERIYNARSEP